MMKNSNFDIHRRPYKTPKPQQKPSPLKREHPSLQNINFFLIVGLFALLDPDPADQNQQTKENGPHVHKG